MRIIPPKPTVYRVELTLVEMRALYKLMGTFSGAEQELRGLTLEERHASDQMYNVLFDEVFMSQTSDRI